MAVGSRKTRSPPTPHSQLPIPALAFYLLAYCRFWQLILTHRHLPKQGAIVHYSRMLVLAGLVVACGSTTPDVTEGVLAEEQVTLAPGEFRAYPFRINTTTQINADLLITIGTEDPLLPVEVLVLTEPDLPEWQASRPYLPVLETSTGGADLSVRLRISDNYRLVISNREQTVATTYSIIADIFWEAP